ncbi:hypothetical protein CVT25_007053 [Psilocybe cyanescens]|uniref:ThuA-like domain-containing protein n=1 Tax=Psilocybe cyanescens TaxID=93625 RepID=A0A409WYA6_PSICY|nr:hypothetical protein CVT25_007053 [Psilocybe cyanescens]
MAGILLVFLHFLFLVIVHTAPAVSAARARILIYSATTGFRHDSIPTAIAALKAKEGEIDTDFVATEDPTQFTDDNLAGFDAVIFLSTTGDVLDDAGQAAFQNYLNLGGNFVGIHSASDTLQNSTFYVKELGASSLGQANFTVDVLVPSHPSVSMLPIAWTIADEAYNFKSDPRDFGAVVVLSANESSYIAWFQEHGAGVQEGGVAGRSFYTSLGHLNETWQNDLFLSHVLGGISWVLQANTTRGFNSSARVGNPMSTISASSSSLTAASVQPSDTQGSTSSYVFPKCNQFIC